MKINKKITKVNFTNSNRANNQIKYLVYHYVGAVSSAKNNADYFYSTYRGASAHYFVDEKEVWQVVEDNDTAWAVGNDTYKHKECRNSNSISIEMCCKKKDGKLYIDDKVVEKAIELGQMLIKKYGFDRKHVLRHYDVTGKICPAPMVNDSKKWTDLLDKLFKDTKPETKPTTTGTDVKDYEVKVTTAVLNVRENPTTASKIVSQIKEGEVYTITHEQKAENMVWGKLKSKTGWISLSYTKKVSTTSTSTKVNKKMKVNAEAGLNVRKTPGGTKVGALANGTQVTVTEEQDGWSKIGTNQWVSSAYLVEVKEETMISVKVGDKVKVKQSATKYVTGETIPSFVKGTVYTVKQISNKKVLLKEIMSWVYQKDLTK